MLAWSLHIVISDVNLVTNYRWFALFVVSRIMNFCV